MGRLLDGDFGSFPHIVTEYRGQVKFLENSLLEEYNGGGRPAPRSGRQGAQIRRRGFSGGENGVSILRKNRDQSVIPRIWASLPPALSAGGFSRENTGLEKGRIPGD